MIKFEKDIHKWILPIEQKRDDDYIMLLDKIDILFSLDKED